jgi:hypothetical protein
MAETARDVYRERTMLVDSFRDDEQFLLASIDPADLAREFFNAVRQTVSDPGVGQCPTKNY